MSDVLVTRGTLGVSDSTIAINRVGSSDYNTATAISGQVCINTVDIRDEVRNIVNPPITKEQCNMKMIDELSGGKFVEKVFIDPKGEVKFRDKFMVAIKTVQVFEKNRTVKVTFVDNTSTVATAQEGDDFSLEYGIAICMWKKYVGDKECIKMIQYGVKKYEDQKKAEELAQKEKEELAALSEKAKRRELAAKENARRARVREMADAIILAETELKKIEIESKTEIHLK